MRRFALVGCMLLAGCSRAPEPVSTSPKPPPREAQPAEIDRYYDAKFWAVWGDGQAEISGYDLTFPRYGQLRKGTAVAIYVTEPFSNSLRVKADPGKHGPADEFPVMKLNLVKDYQTGVYDYNDMLSAFVALAPVNGRLSGTATKVSFSSQEWCGHVYSQILFGNRHARWMQHSYFDGEADQQRELEYPTGGFTEDTLMLWARGMARPWRKPGAPSDAMVLTALETARGKHVPLSWSHATLGQDAKPAQVKTPAGIFEVDTLRLKRSDGSWRAFYVEKASPHRIVRWETSEGETADLLGSDRMKYWEMNQQGGEAALERLGLPRPKR